MALLAHLVTSADICRLERHFYGTFRLIDAASRLIEALLESGCTPAAKPALSSRGLLIVVGPSGAQERPS